tara:strand:- start:395 stop:2716 length:2322 start_codon:yes stop_codon:yes gene_type:complete
MSILSSILGIGGNQPQPVAGPALATQKIPEELAPFYKDILGKAQALYKEKTAEGFQPYQGPTIAQFTPEQEQAFTGLAGLTGQQAPVFTEAMDMTRAAAAPMTAEQVTEYMSPYQQAVVDIEKREAQKQYESQVVPQLAAQAATTGGFGGSRQAILEGMAADTQQRLLGDIQAKGSQQAYEDAVRRFQTDRQASGQAGAQLAQMAPAQFKAQLGEFGALQTVGEQRQRQAQTALDEAFRQYTREQEYPYTTLGRYQATVTGAPIGTTQFAAPTPPPPTLGQTLIGGLGTAAGLYGQFTGKNPLSLITGKKHGGGLSDLPVVNAQNGTKGNLISQYLKSLGITLPRRGDNPFPAELTGDEIEFNYEDEKKQKIKEATDLQRKEMEARKARAANNQDPLLAFDSSQAGRRSSIETVPGNMIEEALGYQGRDIRGPNRLARVPTDRTTQGYSLNKKDARTLDEINAAIVERERARKAKEINEIPIRDVGVINQPPNEGGLPNMVTQTPQLDRGMIQSELDYMKGEDDIAKAQQAYLDNLANRDKLLAEREAGIEDQRTRDQYGNLASFFSRMATATPRRGGLLGVLDASMQVAPESIQAMKDTNKEIRERMENIQDQRQDLETLKLKEDLGMKLSKTERQTARRKEKELNKNTKETLKLEKKKVELMEERIESDLEIAMAKGLDVGPSDHAELRQTFKDFRDRPGVFLPPDKVMEARELETQARTILNNVGSSVYYSDYHNDVVNALTALYQNKSDKKNPNENQQSEEERTVVFDE